MTLDACNVWSALPREDTGRGRGDGGFHPVRGRVRGQVRARAGRGICLYLGMSDASPPSEPTSGRPSAAMIVGQLADADRRRVLATIELGAANLADVTTTAAIPEHRAAKALGRLVDAGLVVQGDGGLAVAAEVFALAAREALARPADTAHDDQPDDTRKVLLAFAPHGRITTLPTAPAKRMVVLDWLSQRFEPGRRYLERDVTDALDGHAVDAVTLRRFLVDSELLDRDSSGEYWRAGGSVADALPDG